MRATVKHTVRWLLVEPRLVWTTLLVLAAAFTLAFWSPPTESRIRVAGCVLELFGLITVAWGIHATRRQFGEDSFATMILKWWARRKRMGITGNAHVALGGLSIQGQASTMFVGRSTIEERVAQLETDLRSLTGRVDSVAEDMRQEALARENALAAERQARQQEQADINTKMALFATGGIYVSLMGVVWLFIGVTLATASNEILCLGWNINCPIRW